MNWVPSYADGVIDGGARAWREAGFDFVTLQPNSVFYDVTPQSFSNTSAAMAEFALGVEMELPLDVRNADIGMNSTTNFYAYLGAARALGWDAGALMSFYYANEFVIYADSLNATLQARYDAICALVAERA